MATDNRHEPRCKEIRMTGAITIALRERLERERRERSAETRIRRLRAIRKRCARLLKAGGPSAIEHGDLLYDENGLPI